jgi:hypothetical protein
MRALAFCVLFLALAPQLAAQGDSPSAYGPTRGQGYTYFGVSRPGGDLGNTAMNLGAGGEGFLTKGLAAGGEAGYMFTSGRFGNGLGLASANLSYHFREVDPDGRWVPFVTGGYTLAFRGAAASLVNYGGGLTYWVQPHWGVRAEFRNHQSGGFSMPSFRFGFSFR